MERRFRTLMTAGVLFTLAACQAKRPDAARSIPSDPDQHLVFVYLDPLPAGPEGLELRIDSVSAVREDGPASPLTLAFDRVVAGKGARERLLASGGVPAGRYTELELRFAAAAAAGEEGRTDLAVPPEGTRTAVHFVAERGRSTVLRLKLDPRTPASGEVRFEPLLAAAVPDRLATGLTGPRTGLRAGRRGGRHRDDRCGRGGRHRPDPPHRRRRSRRGRALARRLHAPLRERRLGDRQHRGCAIAL
jgi:hypothetical protein